MRNIRQFMSGMKNYLVKHGEREFEKEVEKERLKVRFFFISGYIYFFYSTQAHPHLLLKMPLQLEMVGSQLHISMPISSEAE